MSTLPGEDQFSQWMDAHVLPEIEDPEELAQLKLMLNRMGQADFAPEPGRRVDSQQDFELQLRNVDSVEDFGAMTQYDHPVFDSKEELVVFDGGDIDSAKHFGK